MRTGVLWLKESGRFSLEIHHARQHNKGCAKFGIKTPGQWYSTQKISDLSMESAYNPKITYHLGNVGYWPSNVSGSQFCHCPNMITINTSVVFSRVFIGKNVSSANQGYRDVSPLMGALLMFSKDGDFKAVAGRWIISINILKLTGSSSLNNVWEQRFIVDRRWLGTIYILLRQTPTQTGCALIPEKPRKQVNSSWSSENRTQALGTPVLWQERDLEGQGVHGQ